MFDRHLSRALLGRLQEGRLQLSSAYFESPEATLREAQEAKLDRICRKLKLGPDDHVVEIGTGWGSFAMHAAARYGCRVTTTTISREQHALARSRVRETCAGASTSWCRSR
jgi:cyclopropane-fatty-acyl-phospholipid synthase